MPYNILLQPKRILISCLSFTAALLLLLLFSFAGYKKLTVTGKIMDEMGKAIPFASVSSKKVASGVMADAKGEFIINVQEMNETLIIAGIAYESQERRLSKADFKDSTAYIIIILKEKESHLEEVVVTAAFNTKRTTRSVTGTVSTDAVLAGKVAGVHVSGSSPKRSSRKSVAESPKADGGVMHYASTGASKGKAGMLTAGEVNDFKKWKMWEDYNANEFEAHSKKWQLFATQRYAVQLQNKNLDALTGQAIFLINKKNGDTAWTAVTDNTGKAELWKGLTGEQKENELEIRIGGFPNSHAAIPFSQGINRIVVEKECNISNKVEIAFVVDATGSMQDEIDYLKEELEDILVTVSKKDPAIDMHTAAVFYRDRGDEYLTVATEMKQGISDAVDFIKKQNAAGGGDYPEALNSGLGAAVRQLKWNPGARTRIIFLLMDAPPHDEARDEMAGLILQAAAMGIRIVPLACSGTDKATEFMMRSIALATNGSYLFLTDDSGIGNPHIKPTTDEFKVELLNHLLQRTIEQMCYVNSCAADTKGKEPLGPFSNPETVQLFPNPSRGMVTLKTSKKIKEIFLADFAGKILLRKDMSTQKGQYNIDLTGFPSSTYFIKYVTMDNKTGSEKMVLIR